MSGWLCLKFSQKKKMNFKQKFHELSKAKNSLLLAGVDTATKEMSGNEGSPNNYPNNNHPNNNYPNREKKLQFSLDFIEAVADFCVGIKINLAYWQDKTDGEALSELAKLCKKKELLFLLDAKYSDIGSTNDAWMHYAQILGADAITIAAYAGNSQQSIELAHRKKLAVFTMGLMSNPEFKTEMSFTNSKGIKLYEYRVKIAMEAKVDGFVLGATYKPTDNDLQNFLRLTSLSDLPEAEKPLYLVPGLGAQSGKIEDFAASKIDLKRCLFSLSRSLMFPLSKKIGQKNSHSQKKISQQQKELACFWREQINCHLK